MRLYLMRRRLSRQMTRKSQPNSVGKTRKGKESGMNVKSHSLPQTPHLPNLQAARCTCISFPAYSLCPKNPFGGIQLLFVFYDASHHVNQLSAVLCGQSLQQIRRPTLSQKSFPWDSRLFSRHLSSGIQGENSQACKFQYLSQWLLRRKHASVYSRTGETTDLIARRSEILIADSKVFLGSIMPKMG